MILETSGLSERVIRNEDLVWKALEQTLQVLGKPIREAVFHDLKVQSRDDSTHGTKHIDFSMISDSLNRYFGEDTAELVMQRVILRVDELGAMTMAA